MQHVEPKPWLDEIVKKKWKLTKDKCHVIQADETWWKVIIDTPELTLESPNLNTMEYAYDFIEMITAGQD